MQAARNRGCKQLKRRSPFVGWPLGRIHDSMSGLTTREQDAVAKAATLFIGLGASQVFLFGFAVKGRLRPNSDIDMAVSGLPPRVCFSAISKASDLIGRPVDLVDLDDESGLVRYLRSSGELVRVG